MPPPVFNHFFPPTGDTSGHFRLQCKHCYKFVSGSYTSTSNFHTHMKRWHDDVKIDGGFVTPSMKVENRHIAMQQDWTHTADYSIVQTESDNYHNTIQDSPSLVIEEDQNINNALPTAILTPSPNTSMATNPTSATPQIINPSDNRIHPSILWQAPSGGIGSTHSARASHMEQEIAKLRMREQSSARASHTEQEIATLKLREQKRKLEMMEEVHSAKLKVIRLENHKDQLSNTSTDSSRRSPHHQNLPSSSTSAIDNNYRHMWQRHNNPQENSIDKEVLIMKRDEHRRTMEILEEQHTAKMSILQMEKDLVSMKIEAFLNEMRSKRDEYIGAGEMRSKRDEYRGADEMRSKRDEYRGADEMRSKRDEYRGADEIRSKMDEYRGAEEMRSKRDEYRGADGMVDGGQVDETEENKSNHDAGVTQDSL